MNWRKKVLPGFLLLLTWRAFAVEHPTAISMNADCSTCHAQKTHARFVHPAMELPCTFCHVMRGEGDMILVNLMMPKEQICFACHENGALPRKHSQNAKGKCLDCHDIHSSDRSMLLRELSATISRKAELRHSATEKPRRKTRKQS